MRLNNERAREHILKCHDGWIAYLSSSLWVRYLNRLSRAGIIGGRIKDKFNGNALFGNILIKNTTYKIEMHLDKATYYIIPFSCYIDFNITDSERAVLDTRLQLERKRWENLFRE